MDEHVPGPALNTYSRPTGEGTARAVSRSFQRGWIRRPTEHDSPSPIRYVSVVGTSRCDVRAACSGATPSNDTLARTFVPPATTRPGTAQRAIPTIAMNTYVAGWHMRVACATSKPSFKQALHGRDASCS